MTIHDHFKAFAEGLRLANIPPERVEVHLTAEDWATLSKALAQEVTPPLFERIDTGDRLEVAGVRYLVRFGW
jgi:hypothetical protein